jgi:hypothetical protein
MQLLRLPFTMTILHASAGDDPATTALADACRLTLRSAYHADTRDVRSSVVGSISNGVAGSWR